MSTSRLRILPALFKIMLVSSDLWLHLLRFFSWASLSDPCCTNFQLESAALKKSFTVQEQSNLPLRSSNASEDEGYRVSWVAVAENCLLNVSSWRLPPDDSHLGGDCRISEEASEPFINLAAHGPQF